MDPFSDHRPCPSPVVWLVALLFLCGCTYTLNVRVDPRLNWDSPLAVDLVIPQDDAVFDELQRLDASAWFEMRGQLLKDLEDDIDVRSWEWVPGLAVGPIRLRQQIGARRAIVFANYSSDGAHRETIEPLRDLTLVLGETSFTVEFDG